MGFYINWRNVKRCLNIVVVNLTFMLRKFVFLFIILKNKYSYEIRRSTYYWKCLPKEIFPFHKIFQTINQWNVVICQISKCLLLNWTFVLIAEEPECVLYSLSRQYFKNIYLASISGLRYFKIYHKLAKSQNNYGLKNRSS